MFGAEKIDRRHRKLDPTVSVVVPVRNSPKRIATCIEALLVQTYPKDRARIVIIDNDSDDDTRSIAERYPVELVVEKTAHNPYVARNAGVAVATGEIIAFTDANCVPAEDWLTRGVRALLDSGADLAGGRVTFTFSARPTVGEVVDAMTNVDVEASIANHRACMTGNLFVRRAVFDEIGVFYSIDPLRRRHAMDPARDRCGVSACVRSRRRGLVPGTPTRTSRAQAVPGRTRGARSVGGARHESAADGGGDSPWHASDAAGPPRHTCAKGSRRHRRRAGQVAAVVVGGLAVQGGACCGLYRRHAAATGTPPP